MKAENPRNLFVDSFILKLKDEEISELQYSKRRKSCETTAKHESRGAPKMKIMEFKPGDEVCIKSDKNKSRVRDLYMILKTNWARWDLESMDGTTCVFYCLGRGGIWR